MRILLKVLAAAACAWAAPLHAQDHAATPAAVAPPAARAPVSPMGRAMAALLAQARGTQAPPPRTDSATATPAAVVNAPPGVQHRRIEATAAIDAAAAPEQVAVH